MKKIITALLIITLIPTICFAGNKAAYKINKDYVGIQTKVFNDLVKSKKLAEAMEKQIELLSNNLNELEVLDKQKTDAYEKKIQSLQLTIEAKDSIIALKDDNIKQYKNMEILYNANSAKIKKMQRMNTLEKIFIVGLATAGALCSNDTGAQIGIASAGLLGTLVNW